MITKGDLPIRPLGGEEGENLVSSFKHGVMYMYGVIGC